MGGAVAAGVADELAGCPRHSRTHPLRSAVQDAVAVWVCPNGDSVVARVGALEEVVPPPG